MLTFTAALPVCALVQAPHQLWVTRMNESDEAVRAFEARECGQHPAAWTLEVAGVLEAWTLDYGRGLLPREAIGNKAVGGATYPTYMR